MAKTQWSNGSTLTPTFQTAQFGSDANTGHTHDGTDNDGSAPPINLASHVTGTLSTNNLQVIDMGDSGVVNKTYTSGSFTASVTATYFNTPDTATWYWIKIGDIVFLTIGGLSDSSANGTQLQISPQSGNWPTAIVPSEDIWVKVLFLGPTTTYKMGGMKIDNSTTINMICEFPDSSGALATTNWTDSATKGISLRQTVMYSAASGLP